MSIASEITRLQGAKADIKSAIEAKGVTVPSSAKLDTYDDYIGQISSGGSNFDDWVKDGDTHLWIELLNDYQKEVQIRIRMIGTIDWGDGTSKDTVNVTTYTTFTHTYSNLGKYRIDLHPTSGTFYLGGASSSYSVMGSRTNARNYAQAALYQAEIGTSIITVISTYTFNFCYGLRRAYIPKNITSLGGSAFTTCYSLTHVEIEDCSILTNASQNSVFYACYSLQELHGYYAPQLTGLTTNYYACYSLSEVIIPPLITSIAANTFYRVYSMKKMWCCPTSPPTVANSNAFSGFPSTATIYVPIGSLSSYQSKSIWSDYSSQMAEGGTITYSLTNVESSNKTPMVAKNDSFTTTLTPAEGKTLGTVTVKMGGTDITSTAYSAGVVSIASVTGNIIITASAS